MLATLALLAAQPLTLATYAYPRYDREKALAPLGELIGRELGRPVKLRLYPSPTALADALAAGEVDLAMTNLAAYAAIGGRPEVRAVAVLDVPAATLERYRGVLVARAETGLSSLADIRAKAGALRYAEVLPGSTSGALVQAGALSEGGKIAIRFAQARHAGTHEAALDELLAGRADVAALAEEPWRKLMAERPEQAASLREVWRSPPLPPGPVVCVHKATLDCAQVARLLTGPSDAAVSLAAGWSETAGATAFRPVPAAFYAGFVSAP